MLTVHLDTIFGICSRSSLQWTIQKGVAQTSAQPDLPLGIMICLDFRYFQHDRGTTRLRLGMSRSVVARWRVAHRNVLGIPFGRLSASLSRRFLSAKSGDKGASGGTIGTYESLTQLGRQTDTPSSPHEATLERVPNAHPGVPYLARFTCPEFTSICPVTGQPDFAHLVIDYVPADWLVESKSLKQYLTSFRNHGDFHEACTVAIGQRLVNLLEPNWLRIGGYWYPRGGIPIDVFFATGEPPKGLWIPDQGCPTYRGRG